MTESSPRQRLAAIMADRLQALAEPGGIVVSDSVRGAVKNRVAATFDNRRMQAIKNIGDPMRAFSVRLDGSPVPPAATVAAPDASPCRSCAQM